MKFYLNKIFKMGSSKSMPISKNDFNSSNITSVFLKPDFKLEYNILRGKEDIIIVEHSQYQIHHEVFNISNYISIRLELNLFIQLFSLFNCITTSL